MRLSNLLYSFKIPKIPKSLQEKFADERKADADRYVDFFLKYVGWSLVLLYSSVDFLFSPENTKILFAIRMSSIPMSYFFYKCKDLPFLKYIKVSRVSLIWVYSVFLLHILVFLNTKNQVLYPYSAADHLGVVVLAIFLQLDVRKTAWLAASIYVPYILYLAVVDFNLSSILFVFNTAVGISASVICNSILRTRNIVFEFIARQQLEADARIGENIAQISHDTRAPLAALMVLQNENFDLSEAQLILRKSVSRLIELVENITQSASSLQINIQNIELDKFFKECQEYLLFLYPEQKINWEIKFESVIYPFDKNKIKRVLINLVDNAVKASDPPRSPIAIRGESSNKFQVSVLNQGPGFESDTDFFKKGFSKFGSSGLGLHFCQQVIFEHGGQIHGSHKEGQTQFQFTI